MRQQPTKRELKALAALTKAGEALRDGVNYRANGLNIAGATEIDALAARGIVVKEQVGASVFARVRPTA